MVLSDYYNRLQDGILSERLDGTYVKKSPSKCSKYILALGILNFAYFISSLYTYLNLSVTNIPYTQNVRTKMYLPKGTNYMYIDIGGIYQNYTTYAKSISYSQLKGKTTDVNLQGTWPFDYNGGKPYYPAGAIAATYPQDIFEIVGLDIDSTGITHSGGKKIIGYTEYKPNEISIPENWTGETNYNTQPLNTFRRSGLPILNERFVNWTLLAPFSNFKKLWGKVEVERSGYYDLLIDSKYDLPKSKGVIFSEKSVLGLPNYYAVGCYLIVGILSIGASVYLSKFGY